MGNRVDYQIEKYVFTEVNESPRIARQWAEVLEECREEKAGSEERLRIALLNVDYVSSFELPFRLLLIRTPQLIERLRNELQLNQKTVLVNDKKRCQVYSLKADLSQVPDDVRYRFSNRIRRNEEGVEANLLPQIAKQVKDSKQRLKLALETGLTVNALDGLFWLGSQRIAADVSTLRTSGMNITTSEVEVYDDLTATTRTISAYRL